MRTSGCRQEKKEQQFAGCRTSSVGAVMPGSGRELYYCSLDEAECSYALPVGYDIVCKHPDSELFSKQQTALPPSPKDSCTKKRSRS